MDNSDKAWERLAALDPYHAVLTSEAFRRENLTGPALTRFFESGERHVEWILQNIRKRVDPEFSPRSALDFGCGVGRILIPLARNCERVVGVDVSQRMIEEARSHLRARAITNVELVQSDDELRRVEGTFDLVHSFVVLQHIAVSRGERIFRRLFEKLNDDGVGAIHLTFRNQEPLASRLSRAIKKNVPLARGVANLMRGRAVGHPMMQMNDYSLNRIMSLLAGAGATDAFAEFTDHGGHLGAMIYFQRRAANRSSAIDHPLKGW